MIYKWKCKLCKQVSISGPKRHQLDSCNCGKAMVDNDIYYSRFGGHVEVLEEFDYDFDTELLICAREQGIQFDLVKVKNFEGLYYYDTRKLSKIREELLKQLLQINTNV